MTDLIAELEDACRRGGGRTELRKEGTGDTMQCITDHGKLEVDEDNRENVPTKARGQSITEQPVKMKGTIRNPDSAHYDKLNNRIVVKTKDGDKLTIHNDHHKEDNGGGY